MVSLLSGSLSRRIIVSLPAVSSNGFDTLRFNMICGHQDVEQAHFAVLLASCHWLGKYVAIATHEKSKNRAA